MFFHIASKNNTNPEYKYNRLKTHPTITKGLLADSEWYKPTDPASTGYRDLPHYNGGVSAINQPPYLNVYIGDTGYTQFKKICTVFFIARSYVLAVARQPSFLYFLPSQR